jgi:drug/metabolite transporter (DMT)-like permease
MTSGGTGKATMLRVVIAMTLACAAAAIGQILVRQGMLRVGPLDEWGPAALAGYVVRTVTNPYVVGGTALNAIFYFLFVASLSWAGVTLVLPLTALEYLFAAILGVLWLKELVTPARWVGIALVVAGVAVISLTESAPTRTNEPAFRERSQAVAATHGS